MRGGALPGSFAVKTVMVEVSIPLLSHSDRWSSNAENMPSLVFTSRRSIRFRRCYWMRLIHLPAFRQATRAPCSISSKVWVYIHDCLVDFSISDILAVKAFCRASPPALSRKYNSMYSRASDNTLPGFVSVLLSLIGMFHLDIIADWS